MKPAVVVVFSPTKSEGDIYAQIFPLSKNCTVRFIQRGHNVTEPQEQKTQTPKGKKRQLLTLQRKTRRAKKSFIGYMKKKNKRKKRREIKKELTHSDTCTNSHSLEERKNKTLIIP